MSDAILFFKTAAVSRIQGGRRGFTNRPATVCEVRCRCSQPTLGHEPVPCVLSILSLLSTGRSVSRLPRNCSHLSGRVYRSIDLHLKSAIVNREMRVEL